jgi:hypothetical protein
MVPDTPGDAEDAWIGVHANADGEDGWVVGGFDETRTFQSEVGIFGLFSHSLSCSLFLIAR